MSEREQAVRLEAALARIYTDAAERARFLADPRAFALAAGLDPAHAVALAAIDRPGLELAARGFAHKRTAKRDDRPRRSWLHRLFDR